MPTRVDMEALVRAHAALPDDPMDTAIWIRQESQDAWLVEVLPDMGEDKDANKPVMFNPGRDFRYPLHLIAANEQDIREAIRRDRDLAAWVAAGEVLHGPALGEKLQRLARETREGCAQAS